MTNAGPCALVTGGTGFIGTRLVRHLVGLGWEVHLLVRPTSSLPHVSPSQCRLHVDDGTSDSATTVLAVARPDVCFHLAGYVVAQHGSADIAPLISANVLLGTRLAEAAARTGTTPLFVSAGSYWQHADGESYRPTSLYAATKQAFQDVLQFYAESQLLRVVNLKLSDTYGLDDPRPKLLSLLLQAAATGVTLKATAGEQFLDLVHVDDAARAFIEVADTFLLSSSPLFKSFSISSGAPITVRDLAHVIEEVTGCPVPVEWGALPYRQREMFTPWYAGEPLPGWTASIPLAVGLRQLWDASDLARIVSSGTELGQTASWVRQ